MNLFSNYSIQSIIKHTASTEIILKPLFYRDFLRVVQGFVQWGRFQIIESRAEV